MELSEEEKSIQENAHAYIRSHVHELVAKFASPKIFLPVTATNPVSLFMAGSPGAGKTEVSKSLVKNFNDVPVRIDADEIRVLCPEYEGSNSHLFQKAANKGVNILLDYALGKNLNFILDGTFAHAKAVENIKRSLDHKRVVELWFVYQEPLKAWEFTKAREIKESRRVSKEVFIKSFFDARKNANSVKAQFGDEIELNLLIKNYETNQHDVKLNLATGELDSYIKDGYSEDDLQRLLL